MLQEYIQIFLDGYSGYWSYLSTEILYPSWRNYFWWLLGISLVVWGLEIAFPWRKNQAAIRVDFWLDGFYMFFNFFIFSLIGYNAVSNVAAEAFTDVLAGFGIENLVAIQVASWPVWAQFALMFVLADFMQWNIHRLLHYSPWLWEFHKVHHSVEQLGFAACLRFHWMETVIYKSLQYIPLAMIGFGLDDLFILHIVTIVLGHINHANVKITYGPLKYLINNPVMHLWHHAKELPAGNTKGVNYGISLSIWDYLFGTAYIPNENEYVPLGFEQSEKYPKTFLQQLTHPWKKK